MKNPRSRKDSRPPRPPPVRYAKVFLLRVSFLCSLHLGGRWYLVNTRHGRGFDVLGVLWCREHECIGARRLLGFPVPDDERILRRTRHGLARDHVFARNRTVADFDLDLPVGVLTAEGEVL